MIVIFFFFQWSSCGWLVKIAIKVKIQFSSSKTLSRSLIAKSISHTFVHKITLKRDGKSCTLCHQYNFSLGVFFTLNLIFNLKLDYDRLASWHKFQSQKRDPQLTWTIERELPTNQA